MIKRYWISLLVTLLAGGLFAAPTDRDFLVNVITPPLAYSDSQVDQTLKRHLTRRGDLRVRLIGVNDDSQLPFPEDHLNIDSLLDWGREVGGRYLMVVEITSERLEKRKGFHVPLVFHKYENVGIIEGEMRLIDLSRGKLLSAEPFKLERKGPRIFQATMDDEINDPDLHLTAPDKIRFFGKLEESLCEHLADRVSALAGGR